MAFHFLAVIAPRSSQIERHTVDKPDDDIIGFGYVSKNFRKAISYEYIFCYAQDSVG